MLHGEGGLNLSAQSLVHSRTKLLVISSEELGDSNTRKGDPFSNFKCFLSLIKLLFGSFYNILYSCDSENLFSDSLLSFLFQIGINAFFLAHFELSPSFLSSHDLWWFRLFLTWRCGKTHPVGFENLNFFDVVNCQEHVLLNMVNLMLSDEVQLLLVQRKFFHG